MYQSINNYDDRSIDRSYQFAISNYQQSHNKIHNGRPHKAQNWYIISTHSHAIHAHIYLQQNRKPIRILIPPGTWKVLHVLNAVTYIKDSHIAVLSLVIPRRQRPHLSPHERKVNHTQVSIRGVEVLNDRARAEIDADEMVDGRVSDVAEAGGGDLSPARGALVWDRCGGEEGGRVGEGEGDGSEGGVGDEEFVCSRNLRTSTILQGIVSDIESNYH